eukprot:5999128-Pyramimonas_sp.AAC.1
MLSVGRSGRLAALDEALTHPSALVDVTPPNNPSALVIAGGGAVARHSYQVRDGELRRRGA